MKRSKQKGVALIFALIFILVLSVTAATLMFLSQSETWSSLNYRLMTQSRYGAEAGLHAAANYLMAGNNTVSYSVSAELLVMRQVRECQNLQNLTAQLWRLTSHGDIGVVTTAVRNAEVEVSALLESHVLPCYNYAGFATGNGCGSISFN